MFAYSLDDPACRRYIDVLGATARRWKPGMEVLTLRRPRREVLTRWRPGLSIGWLASSAKATESALCRAFERRLCDGKIGLVHWAFVRGVGRRLWRGLFRRAEKAAPMLATVHDATDLDYPIYLRGRDYRRFRRIVVLSRRFKERFLARWVYDRDKVEVIPNGVAPAFLPRPSMKRPGRGRYILTLSRLRPVKGLHVLIMAFRQIHERYPDLELRIAGGDKNPRYFRQLNGLVDVLGLRGRVRFLGEIHGTGALRAALENCALYVQSSFHDGISFSVLEAAAAGCPMVLTRTGGIEEILRHGKDCLFVPTGDAGALARSMGRILKERDLRFALARSARRTVRSFDARAASRKYFNLYARLLSP